MPYGRCYHYSDSNGGFLSHGYNKRTDEQIVHVRYSFIVFVASVINNQTGDEIIPTTMKSYILGFQRLFNQQWSYDLKVLSGKIFNCPNSDLTSVLDNKARKLQ